jgi:hypothetical protein
MTAYHRPPKFERFTHPDASATETEVYYTLAPFDEAVRAMDIRWGQDRLPGLVSAEMAQKYGKAVAALDQAIRANDPEAVRQNAVNCAKGLAAMDRVATEAGQPVADPQIWQFNVDGFQFAIIRDARMWPALRKQFPAMAHFTDREVANAIKAYHLDDNPVLAAAKAHFPGAEVSKITPRPKPTATDLDDEIPL